MTGREGLRVVAIADADSFVKWSAALLASVAGIRRHLLLVRTPLTVSREQETAALAGSGFSARTVTRIGFDELFGWLNGALPDVVVLAGRGPFVRLVARQIDRLAKRPVVVSGLPGMSIPAQRGALEYRRESDLLVLHSRREMRAFAELSRRIGVTVPLGLATLPFAQSMTSQRASQDEQTEVHPPARDLVGVGAGDGARVHGGRRPIPVHSKPGATPGRDLVFASQALVPSDREQRTQLARTLRKVAEIDPTRRVVVKLRSRHGETETHWERDTYADLLAARPENLVFSHEPMATALARAEGLVTVSSTAVIEAIARGVPAIALDTFGVHKTLLNTVFVGSGLLGGAEEVVGRRFRHPHTDWMRDNYFHAPEESTWWSRVEELVTLRRDGRLPSRTVPSARAGVLHAAWHRVSVLGNEDRSALGRAALGVGVPLVRGIVGLRRAQGRTAEDSWNDPETDYTLEPTPHRDPIRR